MGRCNEGHAPPEGVDEHAMEPNRPHHEQMLPSLIALRVFASAGTLQSFSNAALELHVTQGAVSRQIRTFEDELGVKLFTRLTRQVELTEVGRKYLDEVQSRLLADRGGDGPVRLDQAHAIFTSAYCLRWGLRGSCRGWLALRASIPI